MINNIQCDSLKFGCEKNIPASSSNTYIMIWIPKYLEFRPRITWKNVLWNSSQVHGEILSFRNLRQSSFSFSVLSNNLNWTYADEANIWWGWDCDWVGLGWDQLIEDLKKIEKKLLLIFVAFFADSDRATNENEEETFSGGGRVDSKKHY